MARRGKRYLQAKKLIPAQSFFKVSEGIELVLKTATARFDETIDLAIRLGIDAKQSDQQVRGSVSLPHGTGKTVRVLVITKGPKEIEAKNAGADYVGAEEMIQKIQEGWLDFDKVIATPDMMGLVSKVAKILGPRGLMPNPKTGTVTLNVADAVKAEKRGKVDFRNDKAGIIHTTIGKKSMGSQKLLENLQAVMDAVVKAKPATAKGVFLRSVTLSSSQGPGVKLDPNQFLR